MSWSRTTQHRTQNPPGLEQDLLHNITNRIKYKVTDWTIGTAGVRHWTQHYQPQEIEGHGLNHQGCLSICTIPMKFVRILCDTHESLCENARILWNSHESLCEIVRILWNSHESLCDTHEPYVICTILMRNCATTGGVTWQTERDFQDGGFAASATENTM